jgi:hypothetical protein
MCMYVHGSVDRYIRIFIGINRYVHIEIFVIGIKTYA